VSLASRRINLAGVLIPPLAIAAVIALLWDRVVGGPDLAILAVLYLLTGLGITVGFHRLLTHRAFETYRPIRYTFAVLGSLAMEGPVITWVADHRKHHAHADRDGDPHSPHAGHGPGLRGAVAGLYHAHVGWLFRARERTDRSRYARDLVEDRGMVLINRAYVPIALLSLAGPAAVGFALTGSAKGALTGFVWGGLVRMFLIHHMSFSINSICHFFGRRRFPTSDESTNVFWLAPLSFGESWHNNHHAFPRSASHGLRWWELDVGSLVIRGLRRLGLAWNVVLINPERQRARAFGRGPRARVPVEAPRRASAR
jgi:stearoyl-CoA desaturase (delta-9 desaturase)